MYHIVYVPHADIELCICNTQRCIKNESPMQKLIISGSKIAFSVIHCLYNVWIFYKEHTFEE